MAIEDAVVLADQVQATKGNFGAAFLAYQKQRYLRTTRVQLTARMYGDIYHAADAVRDLRRQMLGGRTPEQAYNGVAWLYDGI
jgi:salicylate hydroxylase